MEPAPQSYLQFDFQQMGFRFSNSPYRFLLDDAKTAKVGPTAGPLLMLAIKNKVLLCIPKTCMSLD